MTQKELLYVEDALSHAQFCITKCDETVGMLNDPQLKMCVQKVADKNRQIFESFYGLL